MVDAAGLQCVDLIRESSWDVVLSDVGAGASERPGDLPVALLEPGRVDRERSLASTPPVGWRHGFPSRTAAEAELLLLDLFLPEQEEPLERVSGRGARGSLAGGRRGVRGLTRA
jgi:hypothetical protein